MDDLTGLGKAAEKLIGEVSKGIGVLYKPRAIRKEAEARAYEVKLLGQASTEVEAERIKTLGLAEVEKKLVIEKADEELLQRTKARLLTREVRRQKNIENIAEEALKALPENVSPVPIDDDWRARFFNIAEDITDNDMQQLWGRILAGETTRPGSYSLRALDTLRNLTRSEAELFRQACSLVFNSTCIIKLSGNDLSEFGLDYTRILRLRAAGLVHEGDLLNYTVHATQLPVTKEDKSVEKIAVGIIEYCGRILKIEPIGPGMVDFKFQVIALTPEGRELVQLVKPEPNVAYLQKVIEHHKGRMTISDWRGGRPQSSGED